MNYTFLYIINISLYIIYIRYIICSTETWELLQKSLPNLSEYFRIAEKIFNYVRGEWNGSEGVNCKIFNMTEIDVKLIVIMTAIYFISPLPILLMAEVRLD